MDHTTKQRQVGKSDSEVPMSLICLIRYPVALDSFRVSSFYPIPPSPPHPSYFACGEIVDMGSLSLSLLPTPLNYFMMWEAGVLILGTRYTPKGPMCLER